MGRLLCQWAWESALFSLALLRRSAPSHVIVLFPLSPLSLETLGGFFVCLFYCLITTTRDFARLEIKLAEDSSL